MIHPEDYTIVIYHKNCLDGFGAACAVHATQEEGEWIEYYAVDYQEREAFLKTIDLTGARVFILDFSFTLPQMTEIMNKAKYVVWLDHHESAFKEHNLEFADYLRGGENFYFQLSANNKSGALLAWNYFFTEEEIPKLIYHIDDRDRWQWKLRGTKAVLKALGTLPMTFAAWERYFDDEELKELHIKGKAIIEYADQQLKGVIDATRLSREIKLSGHACAVCNLPPQFASEAGNLLALESGAVGATWFVLPDGKYKWSLRSVAGGASGNSEVNVAEIASTYGGGGHKNAAGFVVDADVHSRILSKS